MSWLRLSKSIIHWLLVAAIVVLLISGLGITEYRIVGELSLGLLGKALAHKIHTMPAFWISFVVLLLLHIFLPFIGKRKKE
jgi:Ni,Fe-hydrogenase I cytochrome b subunit